MLWYVTVSWCGWLRCWEMETQKQQLYVMNQPMYMGCPWWLSPMNTYTVVSGLSWLTLNNCDEQSGFHIIIIITFIIITFSIIIITIISTPKGAYNACCHYKRKALLQHIAIVSCQVLIFFMDEWTSCHMTALQLTEPRTCDRSAMSPTL